MKKFEKTLKLLATFSKKAALKSSKSVSQFGCYQPKEPKNLKNYFSK